METPVGAGAEPGLASWGWGKAPVLTSWMVLASSSELHLLKQNEMVFNRKCLYDFHGSFFPREGFVSS